MHSPGNNQLEVELRALLSPRRTLSEMAVRVESLGFSFATKQYLRDLYYCRRSVQSIKEVSMDEIGSFSLRLRTDDPKVDGPGELNIKVIVSKGDHSGWQEHQVSVSKLEETARILETIGFRCFFELEKWRFSYTRDDVIVNLEDIVNFGSAIELETFADVEKKAQALASLRVIAHELGIERNEFVEKSITFLVMQQRATFSP